MNTWLRFPVVLRTTVTILCGPALMPTSAAEGTAAVKTAHVLRDAELVL